MKNVLKICLFITLLFTLNYADGKPSKKFEIGKGSFMLNGKPFVIKAAEMHYTRIPAEYWEHRIQMCKALGMNTICIYAFWNIHEQNPDEFNFEGQNDIAAFCKLAQKNGMYIMLRPGPYVCSEWEMGGLPWWLLKKKDIQLRTRDPYFMERMRIYLNQIGKELAGLQITQGGNIIMVQVENEYGAYATDKIYMGAIRDILKGAGFTDVPLFQCDWSSNFKNNALDDVLLTVNFGTGADIDSQFKSLKEERPGQPLMCSEFWSGWFDHWGRKHETREGAVMVSGLKDMLDRNISFSLYMTHGGTTFGHWGGANSPAYSAMCSSYDYDAPISEAGWTTPKYFAVRNLLKNYMGKKEKLITVPEQLPIIEIPEIVFTEIAPIFENLPQAKETEKILPMEDFNQGWGSILYRTTLPAVETETSLVITEAHDWAQVFINGELLGRLDRRRGQNTVKLPVLKAGAQLDILVEAMGRVNFGRAIHDRKGITEKVELIDGKTNTELKNWKVYNLPVDYDFVKSNKYISHNRPNKKPAYYRATFNLEKTGDVFLDMQTWGKGMVWVNGKSIGRFWEIGPQQTLFMPGCWLKKGENEIIVLDLKGPEKSTIKGLNQPILDVLRAEEPFLHRNENQTLSLNNETPVYVGELTPQNGWQDINLEKSVSARYICIEGINAQDGGKNAAIAELYVTGADGKSLSRQSWKIVYANSEDIRSGNHTADKIFDLQESTYWSTAQNSNYPHYLVIDLGSIENITGIKYLPRAEQGFPGMIKELKIYVKDSLFKEL